MKITKNVTVYVIQGHYPGCHGWEDECCDIDFAAARQELRNYRENSPYPARLIRRRVPREAYEAGAF